MLLQFLVERRSDTMIYKPP